MPSTVFRFAAGVALLLGLVACPASPSGRVVSVTIVSVDQSLAQDLTLALEVAVEVTGAANAGVTWSSADPSVATVDGSGVVTAIAPGATTVTATSVGDTSISDTITLTVEARGTLRWTLQFGTTGEDQPLDVAVDASGNVYVAGSTTADLDDTEFGGSYAFVVAYDDTGALRWTERFGTVAVDEAFGIATDAAGNIYVTGRTNGALQGSNQGDADAFVRSYDGDGALRWGRQFGTPESDRIARLAIGVNGFVYAAGSTLGDLSETNLGFTDAFVASLDEGGAVRWTDQFGTGGTDVAAGVAVDLTGTVYVAGYVFGELVAPRIGFVDAFVRSYGP